jgi:hypothetical protein
MILKRRSWLARVLYAPWLFWRTWRIGRGHVRIVHRLLVACLSTRVLVRRRGGPGR